MEWLNNQWNEPDKKDYYLMQIAQEVRRVLSKSPSKIKLKDFLIKFKQGRREPVAKKPDNKTLAQWAKAKWLGLVGYHRFKGKKRKSDGDRSRN